jgi:hypothetical protein
VRADNDKIPAAVPNIHDSLNRWAFFLPLRQIFEGRGKANQCICSGFGPDGCGQSSIFGRLRAKLN